MLVAVLLSSLVTAVAALAVSRHEQAENDRRWCALLVDIGNSQRAVPPKTDSGKRFAAEIDRLRREFGCR
jgi:hypothetical protein